MSMDTIEQLTRTFADRRTLLVERMQSLQDEMEAVKRRRLPGIRSALAAAQTARDNLQAGIAAEPTLFEKRRTRVFHNIKVGIVKGKGVLSFANPAKVVELIIKHLPEQTESLIKVTETPVKSALANLPTADLKRIGVTVTQTGDQVYIAPTDSEIDKLVDALVKEAAEDEEAVA